MSGNIAVAESLIICNINNNMACKTILLLLLFFGSLLPLAAEEDSPASGNSWRPVLGLGVLGAVVSIVSYALPMTEVWVQIVLLMGLAAGIDYVLFLLTRFHRERELGSGTEAAAVTASHTAGKGVFIAAATTILADRPQGYLQRVALGIAGFMLFGGAWAHVGYLANDQHYCGYIILLLVSVQLNDIFAYICGKTFGHRKLCTHTSPNKTIGGAAGAVVLTTIVVFLLGKSVFAGTALANPGVLIALGALLSIAGQLGDLMLSSIKRDLGIKDMGDLIPGHGGLLDRFDSVLLAAPVFFHLINYYLGVAVDQPARLVSGAW